MVLRTFNKAAHEEDHGLPPGAHGLIALCRVTVAAVVSSLHCSCQVEWKPHQVGPAFPTPPCHNREILESHGGQQPSAHGQRKSRRKIDSVYLPVFQGKTGKIIWFSREYTHRIS